MDTSTEKINITISEVMEYLFCPRFIYFMNCLNIPQHEEYRFKVLKGRDIHENKKSINKDYLRKKIGCKNKYLEVPLHSRKYHIRGMVDEVLELEDGTYAPLDYKYAEYKKRLFKTYKYQLVLYGIMIQEMYNCSVKRGFLVYTRSKNYLKEVHINENDILEAVNTVNKIFDIIRTGFFPKRTRDSLKCIDCCYKNICR